MIRGLDIFRERFRPYEGSLVLIGGAACDDWFTRQGLSFRGTKDLDIVLLLEAVDSEFVAAMRQFIDEGGYEIRQRNDTGPPVLYRFIKPERGDFPHMLEIFSSIPEGIDLGDDQTIVPIPADEDVHSLSAILLDDLYHDLIRDHAEKRNGISFANATALIPLKSHAWINLSKRQKQGERVDSKDITKHRNDVFRIAGTLPGEPGPEIHPKILTDLALFLEAFPADSAEWSAILAAIKPTLGGNLKPASLRSAIQTYFHF